MSRGAVHISSLGWDRTACMVSGYQWWHPVRPNIVVHIIIIIVIFCRESTIND